MPNKRTYQDFFDIKQNRTRTSSKYFGDNLNFSLTTNYERKIVARVRGYALRSKFKMIFYFLRDDEYREVRGAQRHLGTLGAEK